MAIKIKQEPISLDDEDEDEEALRLAALQSLKAKQVLKPAAVAASSSTCRPSAPVCRPPVSSLRHPVPSSRPFAPSIRLPGVKNSSNSSYTPSPVLRMSRPQTEFHRHNANPNLISIVPVGDDQSSKPQQQFVPRQKQGFGTRPQGTQQQLRPKNPHSLSTPQQQKLPCSTESVKEEKPTVPTKFSRIDASDSESDDDILTKKKNSSEDEVDEGDRAPKASCESKPVPFSTLEDDSLEKLMEAMEQEMNQTTPVVSKNSSSDTTAKTKSKVNQITTSDAIKQPSSDDIKEKIKNIKKEKDDSESVVNKLNINKNCVEQNVESSEHKSAPVDISKPVLIEPLKVKIKQEVVDSTDIVNNVEVVAGIKNEITEKPEEPNVIKPIRIKSPNEVNSQLKNKPNSPVNDDEFKMVKTNCVIDNTTSSTNEKSPSPSKSTCSSMVEIVERSPVSPITVENSPKSDRTDLLDEREIVHDKEIRSLSPKNQSPCKLNTRSPSPVYRRYTSRSRSRSPLYSKRSPTYKLSSRISSRSPSPRRATRRSTETHKYYRSFGRCTDKSGRSKSPFGYSPTSPSYTPISPSYPRISPTPFDTRPKFYHTSQNYYCENEDTHRGGKNLPVYLRRSMSISPRRYSRSPRRRSISPRRRSISPRRRSISPRRRSISPRRLSRSPRRLSRSRSPRRLSRSPRRLSRSPRQVSRSPRRVSRSPRRLLRSPRPLSRSPRRLSRSPRRLSRSPRRLSRSPRRLSRSPRRLSKSPRRLSHSPRRKSRSPKRLNTIPPRKRSPWDNRTQSPLPNTRQCISRSPTPHHSRPRRNSTSPKRTQHELTSRHSPIHDNQVNRQHSQLRKSLSPGKKSHSPVVTTKIGSPTRTKRSSVSPRRKFRGNPQESTRSSRSPRREGSPRKFERYRQKSISPVKNNAANSEPRQRQSSASPRRKDTLYQTKQTNSPKRSSPGRNRWASQRKNQHSYSNSRSPPRKTSPLQTRYKNVPDKWEQSWYSGHQASRRPAKQIHPPPSKSLSPPGTRDSNKQRSRSPINEGSENKPRRRSPHQSASNRREVSRRREFVERNRDRDRRERRREITRERLHDRNRDNKHDEGDKRAKDNDKIESVGSGKTEPELVQEKEPVITDPVMEARRRKFESTDLVQPVSKKICLKTKSSFNKATESPEATRGEVSSTEKSLAENDELAMKNLDDEINRLEDNFKLTDNKACSTDDVLDLGADNLLFDWEEELTDWNRQVEVALNKSVLEKRPTEKKTKDLRAKVTEKRRHKHRSVVDKACSPLAVANKQPTVKKIKKTRICVVDEETEPAKPIEKQQEDISSEKNQESELKEENVDDVESKEANEDCDLRAELSRRRAERLTKAGSLHETLPKRLLQSAFQGLIGLNRLESKGTKVKESKPLIQSKVQSLPKKRTEKPAEAGKRRVLLLKRSKPSRKSSFQIGLKVTKESESDSLPSYSEDDSDEDEDESPDQSEVDEESEDAKAEELLAMRRKQSMKREVARLPVKYRLGSASALDHGSKQKRKFRRKNQVGKSPSVNIDMHAPSSKKKVSIGFGLKTAKAGKSNKLTLLY